MKLLEKLLEQPKIYNLVQDALGMDFYSEASKEIIKYPHSSILEFGCGTGTILKYITPKDYLGLDINSKYIDYAKKKFSGKSYKFQKKDVLKIGKIKQKFDLVLLINFIHHLSDKELQKLYSLMSKNLKYKYIIVIDSKPDAGIFTKLLEWGDLGEHFRDSREIKKSLRNYLKVRKVKTIKKNYWPYKYPLIVAS